MNKPRASRLTQPSHKSDGVFSQWLPVGSIQRRLFMGILIPLLLLLVVAIVMDKIVMPTVTRQDAAFPLPDFTNQRLVETQMALSDLELEYEIASEEFSPGLPAGVILHQFPGAGTYVKPGRIVKFVTSLGQKMVPIPDLAGKSVRQAMLDLETFGLELGEIQWALSDTLPERVVVFSYPSAGFEVPTSSLVNLMVNRGRASSFTYMPKIIGLTLDQANKRLEDKGLKLGLTSYRTDENFLPETVLEQSEPEGAELDIDTEIDLVVSTIG